MSSVQSLAPSPFGELRSALFRQSPPPRVRSPSSQSSPLPFSTRSPAGTEARVLSPMRAEQLRLGGHRSPLSSRAARSDGRAARRSASGRTPRPANRYRPGDPLRRDDLSVPV